VGLQNPTKDVVDQQSAILMGLTSRSDQLSASSGAKALALITSVADTATTTGLSPAAATSLTASLSTMFDVPSAQNATGPATSGLSKAVDLVMKASWLGMVAGEHPMEVRLVDELLL
jgi:hypothetical protein